MSAPTYRWTCHACEHVNVPGTSVCAKCKFPAIASASEIAHARGDPNPIKEGYQALGKGAGWLAWIAAMFSS